VIRPLSRRNSHLRIRCENRGRVRGPGEAVWDRASGAGVDHVVGPRRMQERTLRVAEVGEAKLIDRIVIDSPGVG